jgi:hypothetical protein
MPAVHGSRSALHGDGDQRPPLELILGLAS